MTPSRVCKLAIVFAALAGVGAFAQGGASPDAGAAGTVRASTVAVPATIDATGAHDVTAALNRFFAGVRPGTTVTFPAGGRYRAEGIVLVAGAVRLTIEGNGATIFATTDGRGVTPPRHGFAAQWPRRREHLEFRQANGLRVHNLTIRGANPHAGANRAAFVVALEGQAGIALIRSRNVVLDDVTVTRTYGDLIYIAGRTTGVTITGSRLTDSGRQGVGIVNGSNVRVTNNDISGIARSVVDLEPPGRWVANDVRIDGNRIGDYVNFLLDAKGGGPNIERIRLESNRVTSTRGISVVAGVDRRTRRDLEIVGNRGTTPAHPLGTYGSGAIIQLTNLSGVIIRDNTQPVAGATAVSLDRVCGLTMTGNDFAGASHDQQVLAPCGATAPAAKPPKVRPRAGRATSTTTDPGASVPPAAVPAGDASGNSMDAGTVALAAGLGVLGGLAIAGGIWWFTRRRSRRAGQRPSN